MTPEQLKELEKQFGSQATAEIKRESEAVEKRINDKIIDVQKGLMTSEAFENFKKEQVQEIAEKLKKLEDAAKSQGDAINAIKENGTTKPKSLQDVLSDPKIIAKIKEVQNQGQGNVEIDLKTAGVTSIGNTIQPMTPAPNSPYLPGAGPLNAGNFFGIMYNPNFITNYVNMGSTNFSMLPWVNETSVEGAAAFVQEGAAKPLWNTRFKVEMSTAKKIAAMTTITEEFDQDLPGFTTIVQRLLSEEVVRKWDDAIYAAVILVATGYTISGLNGQVDDANLWDALRAGIAQIGKNNFTANFIGVNPVTNALIEMQKSQDDRVYLLPPFKERINALLREGNKVAENFALVGDIRQYNVDMYKNLVLKVGYNLDDFQRNQFSVVAEVRYHDYISTNRKTAIAYYNLNTVKGLIASGS